MKIPYSVFETAQKRYSTRSFSKKQVDSSIIDKIIDFSKTIQPLTDNTESIRIECIDKKTNEAGEKLGTYGIIKNASLFLGVAAKKQPEIQPSVEVNLGYQFEQLILYITSLGLGTCWLGGTFDKEAFAKVMKVKDDEIFPIISPVGYPADKKSIVEKIMRSKIKADNRLPWSEIFFQNDFSHPLTKIEAKEWSDVLETTRIAPSAVNKQPWRVVKTDDNKFHFYENHSLQFSEVDLQKIDVGIALAHFQLKAKEEGFDGKFEYSPPKIPLSDNTEYIISWIQ